MYRKIRGNFRFSQKQLRKLGDFRSCFCENRPRFPAENSPQRIRAPRLGEEGGRSMRSRSGCRTANRTAGTGYGPMHCPGQWFSMALKLALRSVNGGELRSLRRLPTGQANRSVRSAGGRKKRQDTQTGACIPAAEAALFVCTSNTIKTPCITVIGCSADIRKV